MLLDRPKSNRYAQAGRSKLDQSRFEGGFYRNPGPSSSRPLREPQLPHLNQRRPPSQRPRSRHPGRKRSRRLAYPFKVAIIALLVASAGISVVRANRGQQLVRMNFSSPILNIATTLLPTAQTVAATSQDISGLIYNVTTPPDLKDSPTLQRVVDEIVKLTEKEGLPTQSLSVSLIDLKTNTIAGYRDQTLRYPASVAKLFWMVAFFAQAAQGNQPDEFMAADDDLYKMMHHSDNQSASNILDYISKTQSGEALSVDSEYQEWAYKREWVNRFFQGAGYQEISLSQKNFPFGQYAEPQGRDRQLFQHSRNRTTTYQTARLLYEIVNKQAISEASSDAMLELLAKDLRPEVWRKDPDNPIQGFLGEGLPPEVEFGSKVGMTSQSRMDAAFVKTRDGQQAYILVVFGNHSAYATNAELFPSISRLVYQRMLNGVSLPAETNPTPAPIINPVTPTEVSNPSTGPDGAVNPASLPTTEAPEDSLSPAPAPTESPAATASP